MPTRDKWRAAASAAMIPTGIAAINQGLNVALSSPGPSALMMGAGALTALTGGGTLVSMAEKRGAEKPPTPKPPHNVVPFNKPDDKGR